MCDSRPRRPFLLALVMVVAVASTVAAQATTAVLRGTVLSETDDRSLANAEVSIPGLKLKALTDSAGHYRLSGIAGGHQIVWIRRLGFEASSAVLTLIAGDTLERDFSLLPTTTTLAAVTVTDPQ